MAKNPPPYVWLIGLVSPGWRSPTISIKIYEEKKELQKLYKKIGEKKQHYQGIGGLVIYRLYGFLRNFPYICDIIRTFIACIDTFLKKQFFESNFYTSCVLC